MRAFGLSIANNPGPRLARITRIAAANKFVLWTNVENLNLAFTPPSSGCLPHFGSTDLVSLPYLPEIGSSISPCPGGAPMLSRLI